MSDSEKTKERGPVEELIAKRLRPLNKKIQRFRGYTSKSDDALNADQRAAIAQLPVLEATVRELEELSKAVEETELVSAARAREVRESADRDIEERVQARLAEHHASIADGIGGFLGLHALLRPAPSDDHFNLTFAPLALPRRLEDEVLATDILRVARMYDDLLAGGDGARVVLSMLAVGSTGDDEDDRVHRLIGIYAAGGGEEDGEDEEGEGEQQEEEQDESNGEAVEINVLDSEQAAPTQQPTLTRGMPLNFLQEDELAQPQPTSAQFQISSYSYEVVEPRADLASAPVTVAPTPQPQPDMTSMDWSAEAGESDGEESAERLRSALASGVATPERSGKSTPQGQGQGRKRRPQKRTGNGNGNGPNGENGSKDPKREDKTPKPREKKSAKPDDGFQEVPRKVSATRGRGRGRGGGRGGAQPREGRGDKPKDKADKDKEKEKEKKSIYKKVQPAAAALHL